MPGPARPPRKSALSTTHPAAVRRNIAAQGTTSNQTKDAPLESAPRTPERPPAPVVPAKVKLTINTTDDVVDTIKDAWFATHDPGQTFSRWVVDAVLAKAEQARISAGLDIIPRRPTKKLTPGRPVE